MKEENYRIASSYNLSKATKDNAELLKELININPSILSHHSFEMPFEIFNELINKDIRNIIHSSQVSKNDDRKLHDFMTSEKMLDFFKTNNNSHDFSTLYSIHHYYRNPIVDNKFIIEQMAKQDKTIFSHISEKLVNDNELMYKIFFEYKVQYNHKEEQVEAIRDKTYLFGSFDGYLQNLILEHDLKLKQKQKRIKI